MPFWFIDDLDQTLIRITNGVQTYDVTKMSIDKRALMDVDGDIVNIVWSDFQTGSGGEKRLLPINYQDVVDSYSGYIDNPTSAIDLATQIEAMIISGWTNIGGGGGDILTAKSQLLGHDGVSDLIINGGANETLLIRDNTTASGYNFITKAGVVAGGLSVGNNSIILVGSTITTKSSYLFAYSGAVSHSQNEITPRTLVSFLIPGGTLAIGDQVMVEIVGRKTSGTGSNQFSAWVHTATTVVAGTQIMASALGSALTTVLGPKFLVTGAATQIMWPFISNVTYGTGGASVSAGALTIANDMYINICNQKNTGTDGFDMLVATVRIEKYRT